MFPTNKQRFAVMRFLRENHGMVIPMDLNGEHPTLNLGYAVIKRILDGLVSSQHVEKHGVWRHLWYSVTADSGVQMLKERVGLPDESRQEEQQAIKN